MTYSTTDTNLLEREQAPRRGGDAAAFPRLADTAGPVRPDSLMLREICTLSYRMRQIALRDVLKPYGLEMRDWQVLCAFEELGSGSQRDAAKRAKLDKVAVNRAATRLKERGLLLAQPNRSDGRSHLLELSDEGRMVTEKSTAALVALEQMALTLSGLSDSEHDVLSKLLGRLSASFDELERADLFHHTPA